tara:strand:- start:3422 stop:4546 length:1125 start_codon:yes stop_codon:yes gene_type:complete
MKIAILTIHWANSYGGSLQSLATQEVLSRYGDVKIIDYKTKHLEKTMWLVRFGTRPRDILRMGKDLFRLPSRHKLLKNFKLFFQSNYKLTKKICSDNDLQGLNEEFDVFVCGSDQIWNPNILESFDLNYYLKFVKDDRKKIAYASSKGSYIYNKEEEGKIISELERFNAIGVREIDTKNYLDEKLSNKKIEHVLDPTLLLDKNEWLSLLNIQNKEFCEPYLFVYTLKKDSFVRNLIKKISSKLNLKVVVIDQDPILGFHADEHIRGASPKDFVDLIFNASFVLTNSFHGTAFAANFEKPFLSIRPETGTNRIKDFLLKIGESNRLVDEKSIIEESLLSTGRINCYQLNELRVESFQYLESEFGVSSSCIDFNYK